MAEPASEADEPFGVAIRALLARNPDPFFVQVGGYDGVSFDPLRPSVVAHDLRGVIVEPIPVYFEKLKALYAGSTRVRPVNCAIAEADGERTIWRFRPEAVERGILPPHFGGISSFLMEDLLAETGVLGRSSPDAETTAALRQLVEAVPVRARTLDSLLAELGVEQVDILQVDTEGYDYRILQLFDFARFRPALVHYEHQHLNGEDRAAAEALLRAHGYLIHCEVFDTLAVQAGVLPQTAGPLATASAAGLPPPVGAIETGTRLAQLFELGQTLRREGRPVQAIAVLGQLAELHPGRGDIRRAYVEALAEGGRMLEALAELNALKAWGLTPDLLALIQAQAQVAVVEFNACLARGDTEAAERYAAALAALMPQNAPVLQAAASCNQVLGRLGPAIGYAEAVVALEPENRAARAGLAELLRAAGDLGREAELRAGLALSPAPDAHELIKLRDLHDAAGLILCRPLTPQSRTLLDAVLAAAKAITVVAPEGSEWAAWGGHYRSLVDALDLELALAPAEPRDPGKAEMLSSDGSKLDWKGLKARAGKLGADCVFFAAADEAYVDLYARWYALSLRKHADAPFVAVIHVIGGKGRLPEIAEKVGVADERLVFTACDFDPRSATVKICDSPPKDWSAKPVAHLQSMRFLRLGHLLEALDLPVFVSDIDLLLQRGVADLLAAHAGEDLVLNENEVSFNAGSRLTANLLLVKPTEPGKAFAAALAAYLADRLGRAEVTRWIDQVGLTLARANLQANRPEAKIGYFDTACDINNVMYPAYAENPFRFFSLFHGFDTSSLEEDKVLGGGIEASAA